MYLMNNNSIVVVFLSGGGVEEAMVVMDAVSSFISDKDIKVQYPLQITEVAASLENGCCDMLSYVTNFFPKGKLYRNWGNPNVCNIVST